MSTLFSCRLIKSSEEGGKGRGEWTGGLFDGKIAYPLGGRVEGRLRLFNEGKTGNIYNVVAAIPGAWESDR
jgi:hypothetical protein